MQVKKPVLVINKPTVQQMVDMRIAELEEAVKKQAEEILELRTTVLEIRKKLITINKPKNNKK